MKKLVSVSILSADFLNLKEELDKVKDSGADMIHFDVMDGIFVNNISFGFPVLKAVDQYSDMCLDVHLMIADPLKYIGQCAANGADIITFHIESAGNTDDTIKAIKKVNAKVGLSIKPDTPFEDVIPYLDKIDLLLIMTVEPGFGGQSFITDTLKKIHTAKKYISEHNLDVKIQVDVGINAETAALAGNAGADIMVAGSYIFKSKNLQDAVASLTGEQ